LTDIKIGKKSAGHGSMANGPAERSGSDGGQARSGDRDQLTNFSADPGGRSAQQ
jgi:hypothetical protein